MHLSKHNLSKNHSGKVTSAPNESTAESRAHEDILIAVRFRRRRSGGKRRVPRDRFPRHRSTGRLYIYAPSTRSLTLCCGVVPSVFR